jgi:tRNA dimethylallyltransferase
MYIKALLDGLFDIPESETQAIRKQLWTAHETQGLAPLYASLQQIDPEAAAHISCNDSHRILRALEIFHLTGKPISKHWSEQQSNDIFRPFRILVDAPRDVLYAKINQRVDEMVCGGLIEEIQSILSKGYSWEAAGFNSVGYKEFRPYFESGLDLRQCVEQTQQHTRNYAKRQFTWYRKCIFHLTIPSSEISISTISKKIKDFLGV